MACRCGEPAERRVRSSGEVGPRDGFQNEPETIPTEQKVELIDALARTGCKRLEVTSFVRADVIPQLADAAEVLARIDVPEEVAVERAGAERARPGERARAAGASRAARGGRQAFDEINVFLSASETHNRKNVNRTVEESLRRPGGRAGDAHARRACAARA